MADKSSKWKENVEGKYYVDAACIASKYCVAVAPDNFKMTESGAHAYVCRQPATGDEEQAQDALRGCPVNAIGEDGEG